MRKTARENRAKLDRLSYSRKRHAMKCTDVILESFPRTYVSDRPADLTLTKL